MPSASAGSGALILIGSRFVSRFGLDAFRTVTALSVPAALVANRAEFCASEAGKLQAESLTRQLDTRVVPDLHKMTKQIETVMKQSDHHDFFIIQFEKTDAERNYIMSAPFLDALRSGRVLLMDGAMGTELRRAGLGDNDCAEAWNWTHPDGVRAIHQAYVDAGAEVLLTNTFQANPLGLDRFGLGSADLKASWLGAMAALAQVVPRPYVLADVGPIIDPVSSAEFSEPSLVETVAEIIHQQASICDAILLETCSSPRALDAVKLLAARGPVLLALAFKHDPASGIVTQSGHAPEWFAQQAGNAGIVALGVNCGRDISLHDCVEIMRRYRKETNLPLFARPNAGTPTKSGDGWVHSQTPETMSEALPELFDAGVGMIGGCCGTTPAHIAAFRRVVDQWNASRQK